MHSHFSSPGLGGGRSPLAQRDYASPMRSALPNLPPAGYAAAAPHLAAAAYARAANNGNTGTSFAYYRPGLPMAAYEEYDALKISFYEELEAAGHDPEHFLASCNREIASVAGMRVKDADAAVIQPVPLLTAFSVKYANPEFIGLNLMPVLPTEQEGGQYIEYRRYAEWDTTRSPGGRGTRVQSIEADNFAYIKRTYQVDSDSTIGYIGKDVVMSTGTPVNGMFDLRERVDYNMAFKRELRIRDVLVNAANYGANNKKTLTAGIRWDDAGGDPGGDILAARAKIWRGTGNSMLLSWCSIDVWNVIRQSPNMLKLLPLGHQGFVTPQQFCDIFGLDGLLVSEAWINTANLAKTPVFGRVWGNYFGITRVSRIPTQRNAAFGYTFRWMPGTIPSGMENNLWFDPKEGDFGSFGYKSALKEAHQVTAADTGYLFVSPIN
jgi:hypothetical protein